MTELVARLQTALGTAYRIERELGSGGMGTVFLAWDPRHDRQVAIKILRPELATQLTVERFLGEIHIAARLTHPHILPLHDSGEADGLLFYVMPFIEGESLRDYLRRAGALQPEEAIRITREVADALDHAHRHNIVHRDIKPENILIEAGHAVLSDFGIARAISVAGGDRLTATGIALGTPLYMSPEQIAASKEVDGRSDIYSLGCVTFEMLTGKPPFTGPNAQAVLAAHLTELPPAVMESPHGNIPSEVRAAVRRALAKAPDDRFATAADMALALAGFGVPGTRRSKLKLYAGLALGVLVLATGGMIARGLFRSSTGPTLNPNLIAVVPFDVLDHRMDLWHEGLMDVLAANLDGAGQLHTVSPTMVVRRWAGTGDPTSVATLAHATGARLAVYGRILRAGDSARVTASLIDAESKTVIGEIEVRDHADRMDRLADSMTVGLLRELGRSRPVGAARLTSLGTRSLPALKAFLQGEQFFRQTAWDSAAAYFTNAIRVDSTFALALRRLSQVMSWQLPGDEELAPGYALRAGALNHGLAPRESLLVAVDSLYFSLWHTGVTPAQWPITRRLVALLAEAERRYPEDPEVWYSQGEANHHFGVAWGVTDQEILDAFNRVIALDSMFEPAYIHPVEVGFRINQPELARSYLTRYLAMKPTDFFAEGLALVGRLLEPAQAQSEATQQLLDSAWADPLFAALFATYRWADSAETATRLGRLLAAGRRGHTPAMSDRGFAISRLAYVLAYRGHLRQALAEADGGPPELFAELALFGAVRRDSARTVFAGWLQTDLARARYAVWWWAAEGDSTALETFSRKALDSGEPTAAAVGRIAAALSRRDTSQALALLGAFPDSLCPGCYDVLLQRARLLAARGDSATAAALLKRSPPYDPTPSQVLGLLILARLSESTDPSGAIALYRFVLAIWSDADPELQDYVESAQAGLKRLGWRTE